MNLILIIVGIFAFMGIGYPFVAWMFYPIYRKLGGKMSYKKYMAQL